MAKKAEIVGTTKGMGLKKFDNVSLLARIVLHARKGRSKNDCFKLVGIHPDTGYSWLKRGREGGHPLLERFYFVFERAVAKFNAEQLAMIEGAAQSGAPNTWQAGAWLLERRDPENWGKRDKTIIEAGDRPLLQINQVILNDPDARDAGRDFLRRVTGAGPHIALGPGMGSESPETGSDEAEAEPVAVDSR